MDNNMQQELDALSNNNQQQIEDAKQTLSYTRVYAYRLYKPTCFDIEKPRFENIVVGDDVKSFFRVHKDTANCYYEFDAFKDKLELSMENSVETNDEQTFERTLKRRIISIGSDISFLDEGNWIFSFDEQINENTDFTKLWVFSANQQEVGFVSYEKDAEILELGDERNPARDLEKSLIMVSMDTFKNLNGYSLSIQYGLPIIIKEDYNLTKINFNGKIYNSLFNQIELRTLDNENMYNNKLLLAKKVPIILNTIENQQNAKFNNLWALPNMLNISTLIDLLTNNNLDNLLKMQEGVGTDVVYEGKGRILQADVFLTPDFDKATWINKKDGINGKKRDIMDKELSNVKKFEINEFTDDLTNGFFGQQKIKNGAHPFRKNQIWKEWPNNPTEHKSWAANNDNGFLYQGDYYIIRNQIGIIRYIDEKGETHTVNNAQIQKADLKFKVQEYYENGHEWNETKIKNFTNKETLFFAWGWASPNKKSMGIGMGIPRKMSNNLNTFEYGLELAKSYTTTELGEDGIFLTHDSPGTNRTSRLTPKFGWSDEINDIKIVGSYSNNVNRLSDLLKKLITFTNAYKNGFPQAKFSSIGSPLNFMAKVKDKFTNSNYAPQQVITNLIEDYKMRNPKDLETEQWNLFLKFVPMLGNYILSDYNISGGLNDQHQILLPWYLELKNTPSKYSEWIDSENREESLPTTKINILIDNTNETFKETGEITDIDESKYSLPYISCIHMGVLEIVVKSKWFDLSNFDYNNKISMQPSFSTSQVSRAFKELNNQLKESDISTIPVDMNLSDEYTSNIFNILLNDKDNIIDYLQQFVGSNSTENWDEEKLKELLEIVKNKNINNILNEFSIRELDDDENEVININIDNYDFDLPTLLSFKGLFGNNFNIEFIWEKTETDEEGNTIISDTVKYELNTDIFNKNDNRVISTKLYL